ncbi:hypothetical protein EN856_35375, partial [Mesorhizobium sp. M8A.F.Ca.ET.213.01.1.1]|uniref:pantoate--beta-alanine ligase n=1 Tax=Mesorhizobium sp. M8A.F.Ca.ET.213.01.1.1 TaxID=2563970 RepID=UPI00109214CA
PDFFWDGREPTFNRSIVTRGVTRVADIMSIKTAAEPAGRLSAGLPAELVLAEARQAILAAGYDEVEYLELRADHDLSPLSAADRPAHLIVAAWLGGTRLIDKVGVLPGQRQGELLAAANAA